MNLLQLIKQTKYHCINESDCEIVSLCTDSRVCEKGDLFFCLRGTRVDSHRFAKEAERRGASAIVCEEDCGVACPQIIVSDGREAMADISSLFYGHPERKLKMVAVTGTNGKTTVTHMLYSIMQSAGLACGMIGTLGAKYRNVCVAPDLTTPDPVALYSLLFEMVNAGVEYVVMEVSAHALALKKVKPVRFEVGIFTNLTQDHLDFFGDMKAYADAKSLLFAKGKCRYVVCNSDDPFSDRIAEENDCVTYGLENPANSFAVIESEDLFGSCIMMNLDDELCESTLYMTGRHNVYNALAAATAARRLGVSCAAIAKGLDGCRAVEGRLEHVAEFCGADIFVDFAHTPDGLQKSLSALREHCGGKLICLFGCGGNRDGEKRAIMGEVAASLCDFSVITSDNPRYEDPCSIIAQIEGGYRKKSVNYVTVQDREKATQYALSLLEVGDILLVAGKGGEHYQEIMGIKYNYNDKDIIKKLIGVLS